MVLYPVIRQQLLDKRVVLASASPRRQEILRNAGLQFEVVPSRFKENLNKASFPTPYTYAMETAKQKALEVAHRLHQKDHRAPDIVIGADTIVAIGGLILEKPSSEPEAYTMLSRLSGKKHSVFTGVSIISCCSQDGQLGTDISVFFEETQVTFSQLSEDMLWDYIHSGEPLDKAGGYGIQGLGGMLVESIHGDFLNVVGFPLNRFCTELGKRYHPQRPEDPPRDQRDSLYPVDTFDIPGAVEAARSMEAGKDAGRQPTVKSLPPIVLLKLKEGYQVSKALFTACKLKLFDALRGAAPRRAVEVASAVGASADGTEQLLDVCVALGLLLRDERGYRNTELANMYLLSDAEYSLHKHFLFHDEVVWSFFSNLEFAIKEGGNQHRRVLGQTTEDPFQDSFYQTRARKLQFLENMHSYTKVAAVQMATAFDFSQFSTACDLGGCTGTLAYEFARQYPHLRVQVFDLPPVIEESTHFQPRGADAERVTFVPGDFFRDPLPEVDLYVVCRILHDWAEDKVHQLLGQVSRSCKPGGCLLVAEILLDDEKSVALHGLLQSLNMLLQTHGGRERSVREYRDLLQAHGFTDVRVVRTGGFLDMILATKA